MIDEYVWSQGKAITNTTRSRLVFDYLRGQGEECENSSKKLNYFYLN